MIQRLLLAIAFPSGITPSLAGFEARQRTFVLVCAIVIAPILLYFSYVEMVRGSATMMILTASGAALALLNLVLIRLAGVSSLASRLAVGFCTLVALTQILENRGEFTFYWPLVIPVVSIFLFGRWEGLLWSVGLFLTTVPLCLFPEAFDLSPMPGAAEDYISAFIVITTFSFSYETITRISENEVAMQNVALFRERDALSEARLSLQQNLNELELTQAREKDFAEIASDWFFELDGEQRFTSVTGKLPRSAGLSVPDLVGTTLSNLGVWVLKPGEASVDMRLALGHAIKRYRLEIATPGHPRVILEISCRPILNGKLPPRGFRGVGSDITQRVEAEKALEAQKSALLQADKLHTVGQLTSGIAHDFNNLLTIVRGNLDLVQEETSGAANMEYLKQASQAAMRAAELTSRLLAFSRQSSLVPRAIQTGDCMDEIQGLLRQAVGPSANLTVEVPDDIWNCLADRAQLESALLNLVLNARDALPEKGQVSIRVSNQTRNRDVLPAEWHRTAPQDHSSSDAEKFVCFDIEDDGCGISEKNLARIFEPFFTSRISGKGTGLGLSMVHRFAYESGGFIEVESETAVGTSMRLYLPTTGLNEIEAVTGTSPQPADTEHRTILVVEDDAMLRNLLRSMLLSLGYQVELAESGESALKVVDAQRIDIVLADIVLGQGMSGLELVDELRSLECTILLMTGYSDGTVTPPYQHLPLLVKPFGKQELEAVLNNVQLTQASA